MTDPVNAGGQSGVDLEIRERLIRIDSQLESKTDWKDIFTVTAGAIIALATIVVGGVWTVVSRELRIFEQEIRLAVRDQLELASSELSGEIGAANETLQTSVTALDTRVEGLAGLVSTSLENPETQRLAEQIASVSSDLISLADAVRNIEASPGNFPPFILYSYDASEKPLSAALAEARLVASGSAIESQMMGFDSDGTSAILLPLGSSSSDVGGFDLQDNGYFQIPEILKPNPLDPSVIQPDD